MSLTEQDTPAQVGTGEAAAGAPTAETGVSTAATPPADTGVLGIVDQVLATMNPREEPPASKADSDPAAKVADGVDPAKPLAAEEDGSALTEDEMKRLPAKTRDRITGLLDQRRTLHTENQTLRTETEQLRPDAEEYRKVSAFMKTNDLSPQDAGQALQLAALIQTNPREAFRAIQPIYSRLAQMTGAVLPNDLAEDMRLGRITQERAYELAASRATAALSEKSTERLTQRQRETQAESERVAAEQRQAQQMQAFARTGDALAAEKAQADPDWKLKEPFVVEALKADLSQNGMPKDEADLRTRFGAIVKVVETRLATFRPAANPVSAINGKGASSSAPPTTPPKSMEEAIFRAMGG